MIGQDRLINKINNLDMLPHTLLLIGEYGSGKHEICKLLSDKFNISRIDITKDINLEYLSMISLSTTPNIYEINMDAISEKHFNILLKSIEEPSITTYFIMYSTSIDNLIPTIVNRCTIWYMDKYSKDDLINFSNNKKIVEIFNTPGKILNANKYEIDSMIGLANNILINISKANWANILVIPNKLSFKEDEELFPIDLFADIIYDTCIKLMCNNKVINEVITFRKKLSIKNIDKQKLFENFLFNLKLKSI